MCEAATLFKDLFVGFWAYEFGQVRVWVLYLFNIVIVSFVKAGFNLRQVGISLNGIPYCYLKIVTELVH